MRLTRTLLGVLLVLFSSAVVANEADQETALSLKPLAWWPADAGEGRTLQDRSGHGHDATLYHVPWEDGLLDFTPAFQWLELPGKDGLLKDQFSLGCWVYNRSDVYLKDGAIIMGFVKPTRLWLTPSLKIKLRDDALLEVSVDNQQDTLGTRAAGVALQLNAWHHLVYTYAAGTATLYMDGQPVASKTDVPFTYSPQNVLQFGGCSAGWQVYPNHVESFFGSLAGMTLFDRALTPGEVAQLREATRPALTPKPFVADSLIINGSYINDNVPPDGGFVAGPVVFQGEQVIPGTLADQPLSFRYQFLENLSRQRGVRTIKPTTLWLEDATAALADWETRVVAANLLAAMQDEQADAVLAAAMPGWIEALSDASLSPDDRAASALALGNMGSAAKPAVPALAAALEALVAISGARIPRVDDIQRNATIRALFQIDRYDAVAKKALAVGFAQPIIDALDLSKPVYAEVKPLAESGDYLKALAALKQTNPGDLRGERYLSQGDPWRNERELGSHTRAYTPKCEHDGIIYSLGHGLSPNPAEPISQEDFAKAVASLSKDYPQAAEWRKPDAPNLYRLKINKIYPDGKTESTYLVGEDFVFDGTDGKIRGWSIAVDTEGYIHIIGGQHNYPNTNQFISGAFLRMGFSEGTRRDGSYHPTDPRGYDPKYPAHMYWVSKAPYDIHDFEFVGAYENPRKITWAECVNYMNFLQDNDGVLYCYFRTASVGLHALGLHRYDTETRRWSPIGASPTQLMADAAEENPDWRTLCVRAIRAGIPGPTEYEALTWAWQPGFYNYMRSIFGIRFDRTNRLHIEMQMRALSDEAQIIDSNVYAYSDDGGETFHRADGSPVKLPLTNNPVSAYNADIDTKPVGIYWRLWKDNLKEAGYL